MANKDVSLVAGILLQRGIFYFMFKATVITKVPQTQAFSLCSMLEPLIVKRAGSNDWDTAEVIAQ